jgi:hypothetical protein
LGEIIREDTVSFQHFDYIQYRARGKALNSSNYKNLNSRDYIVLGFAAPSMLLSSYTYQPYIFYTEHLELVSIVFQ